MRAQLLHLSGPFRGNTKTYSKDNLLIGTDPDAAARFPLGYGVQQRHAEIAYVVDDCAFYLRCIEGKVFVNQKEVEEIILEHGDLLELGKNGPRVRFKIYTEKGSVCKPVRLMLTDARDVGRESGAFAFTNSIARDLFTQSSPGLKFGVPILMLAILLPTAMLAGWFGASAGRARIDQDILEIREQQQAHASRDEIDSLRREFAIRSGRIDRLITGDEALKRIHNLYSRGVCLLHGIYGFKRETGQGDEYLSSGRGEERLQLEYTGSGFLVSDEGHLATNRHVAVPWEFDPRVQSILEMGWQPEFLRFVAYFPGLAPIPIDQENIWLREDDLDVAVLKVRVENVPVLPLSLASPADSLGQDIIVVGFPTGINALLAKADSDLARAVAPPGASLTSIIDGLAEQAAVSPIITRGSLNEVLEHKLVYDAETTSGGSGGPVFGPDGRVIGVNFAIVKGFAGSNFGVPVRFLRELLR